MEKESKHLSTGMLIFILTLVTVIVILAMILAYKINENILLKNQNMELQNTTSVGNEEQNILEQVENNIIKNELTNKENLNNETESVPKENKFISSGRFTISSIKETETGYALSVHMLSDEVRIITEDEYSNLVHNGGSIEFRGHEWLYFKDDEENYLREYVKLKNGDEYSRLRLFVDEETNKRVLGASAGKVPPLPLHDYKSNEITIINIDKDIKVCDNFSSFYYDQITGEIKVKVYGEEKKQDETTTKEFINNLTIDAMSDYGECEVYMLNGKIVALQSHRASG